MNLHRKRGIWFSSDRFFHKCLFQIPLWREIDNATSYFLVSSKKFKSKQYFHTDTFWNYQLLEGDEMGTDEQPFSEKATVDRLWRNLQYLAVVIWRQRAKFCVKEMKKKSVAFCFLKLKAKWNSDFFQIIEGGWLSCGKFRFLLSKLMFTHSVSCWRHSHRVLETYSKWLSP